MEAEDSRSNIEHIENETLHDTHVQEIHRQYTRIDHDWLLLHYKASIGLVLFASIVECIMGLFLINSDMLTTTVQRFLWKFMFLPAIINFACIVIDTAVMKSKRLSQEQKIYTISLVFVGICFIFFTVHSAFTAIYYIFAIAIMLTTIYASYRLTIITALTSIASLVISELFIVWDVDKVSIFGNTIRMSNFLISLCILTGFSIACMVVIRFEQKKNEASIRMEIERKHLQQRLQADEMTGIFNRRALHAAFKDIEEDSRNNACILAIADIDNFKNINDQWGHHVGDRCIIEFARVLKEHCGDAMPFRYGGDEFCLLFRHADLEAASASCNRIQEKLLELRLDDIPALRLTASFGLAVYSGQTDTVRLFIHADHALYEAKELRNAIRVFA